MRKLFFAIAMLSINIGFVSCRETTEKETVVREVEVEKRDEKGILERTAEKVDDEVNKEVNEEIEKIGDDN